MEVLSALSIKSIKGGSGPSQDAIKVGTITDSTTQTISDSTTQFPTVRPDGTELHDEDWVVFMGTPPKTIANIEFTKVGERAYYDVATSSWSLSTGILVNSSEVLLSDSVNESLSTLAISQEEANKEFVIEIKKRVDKTTKVGTNNLSNDITAQNIGNDIKDLTLVLTNKTINADDNTISNLEADNLKSGVLLTAISNNPSDTSWISEKAISTELDKKVDKTQKVGSTSLSGDITANNIFNDIKDLIGTLTNKTIDADDNDILDLTLNNFKQSAVATSISNDSNTIPRTSAVYNELLSDTNSSQTVSYANNKLSLKTTLKNNSNSSAVDKSTDILTKVTDYSTLSDTDKLSYLNVSSQELKDVALSAVNTYIQSKLNGAISNVLTSNLTTNSAVVTDVNGKLGVSACTATELGYVHGVTGLIQDQINSDLILESYPMDQVLDLAVSNFTINDPSKYNALVIIDRNKTKGVCFLNFYADRSTSQSSTGWKRVSAILTSWQYKPWNSGTSLREVSRCLGSMYVSDYVNMVFSIYSDGDIQSYYTSGLTNKTGGINVSLTFPITLR